MKNLFSFVAMATFSVLTLLSCDNNEKYQNNVEGNVVKSNSNPTSKFYIYYADCDWGRDSLGCDGWGLCNYTSCWFCNVPLVGPNVATILIDSCPVSLRYCSKHQV